MINPFGCSDKQFIAQHVNKVLGISIGPDDVCIEEIVRQTNDDSVVVAFIAKGYAGVQRVVVARAGLSQVLGTNELECVVTYETRVSELLPQINSKYNLHITEDDIYDAFIADGKPIVFKATSMRLSGEFRIKIVPNELDLSKNFNNVHIDMNEFGRCDGRMPAEQTFPILQCFDIGVHLRAYEKGQQIGVGGVASLAIGPKNSTVHWADFRMREVDYNLYGATVVYNGLTKYAPYGFVSEDGYPDNVLIIRLSQWCANYHGHLVIVY